MCNLMPWTSPRIAYDVLDYFYRKYDDWHLIGMWKVVKCKRCGWYHMIKIKETKKVIIVYVRSSDGDSEGILGEFSPDDLPKLVQKFGEYYTIFDLGDRGDLSNVVGQFVIVGNDCHFEIVIGNDPMEAVEE